MFIRHFRTLIHFCAFVGFATMSNCSMHGHGSFKTSSECLFHAYLHIQTFRQSVSNCNTTSCLYLIHQRYIATVQPMYVQCNIEARSCNYCSGKAMSIKQPECVYLWPYVSSMQCSCALLSSAAYPTLQCFSTLSHTRHDFRKRLLNIKCVLSFCTTFVSNISLSKKN